MRERKKSTPKDTVKRGCRTCSKVEMNASYDFICANQACDNRNAVIVYFGKPTVLYRKQCGWWVAWEDAGHLAWIRQGNR